MSSMQTINEACSCGATFSTSAAWSASAQSAVRDWREGHKHTDHAARLAEVERERDAEHAESKAFALRLAEAERERDDIFEELKGVTKERDIALHRAEAAEAKVAAVEALADEWEAAADRLSPDSLTAGVRRACADQLRAALGEA